MKSVLIISIIFTLGLISKLNAQELGIGIDAGYSYKFINRSVSQYYIGGIISGSKGHRGYSSYDPQFLVGIGSYYGRYNGKGSWIPAVSLGYGRIGYIIRGTITPYSVTPSLNLNLFNYVQAGVGYNIGFRKKNDFNMNGIVLSFNINLSIIGHYINIST